MIFSGTKSLQQWFLSGLVFPGSPTGAEVTGAPEGRKGGKEPTESWMGNPNQELPIASPWVHDGRILQPFWSLGNYGNLEPQKKSPSFWKKKIVGQIEEDWSFFVGTQMLRMATSLCSILGEMQYLFGSCFRVLVPTVAVEVFQVLLRADYTQGKPIQIQSTKSAQDCSESNTWCPIQINEYYNLPTSIVSMIMSRNPCPKIPPLWAARHASQASATHVLIPDFPFLRAGFCCGD